MCVRQRFSSSHYLELKSQGTIFLKHFFSVISNVPVLSLMFLGLLLMWTTADWVLLRSSRHRLVTFFRINIFVFQTLMIWIWPTELAQTLMRQHNQDGGSQDLYIKYFLRIKYGKVIPNKDYNTLFVVLRSQIPLLYFVGDQRMKHSFKTLLCCLK